MKHTKKGASQWIPLRDNLDVSFFPTYGVVENKVVATTPLGNASPPVMILIASRLIEAVDKEAGLWL